MRDRPQFSQVVSRKAAALCEEDADCGVPPPLASRHSGWGENGQASQASQAKKTLGLERFLRQRSRLKGRLKGCRKLLPQ